jgi:hypothetical protein
MLYLGSVAKAGANIKAGKSAARRAFPERGAPNPLDYSSLKDYASCG